MSSSSATAQSDQSPNAMAEAQFARVLEDLRARRPLRYSELRESRRALDAGRPDIAAPMLALFLRDHPGDVDTMNLLAEAAVRAGRDAEAQPLLAQCVASAPDFAWARFNYARVLHQMSEPEAALVQLKALLENEPDNPLYRDLEAAILAALGRHEDALARRRALARDFPGSAKMLVACAQTLRTLGRQDECIAAFREAIAILPSLGAAWWGLANLRTYRFAANDVDQLEAQLARRDLSSTDRVQLLFALGKAFGELERYAESFDAYSRANAMRRLATSYDPEINTAQVSKSKAVLTKDFFRERMGCGSRGAAPIFVVGMQRSGTTLLEQILASHSAIEGAGELPNMRMLARHLEQRDGRGGDYPGVLAKVDTGEFEKIGNEYLEATRPRRPLGRPFFVDKDPFNFWHAGFIHLILPNAKIIDIRRHPLGCCFSNFTSLFLHQLPMSYRLADMGRFYADYVALMDHYDEVLPGRVHRIFYEDLVMTPEAEIRRLLDHLGLPFEPACLEFHENDRAVSSASSEQVRQPIFREALGRWRHYEAWLGPLKATLGAALTDYPRISG